MPEALTGSRCVDMSPEPMVLVSHDGTVHAANRAFAATLRCDVDALTGACLLDYLVDGRSDVLDYLRRCAASAQCVAGALTLRRSDGKTLALRTDGWSAVRRLDGEPPVVAVRFARKASAAGKFAQLSQQIHALNTEVARRRRVETELAESRQAAELAERRARFLATAGGVFTQSLEYEATLKALATLAVPEIADWCAVDVLEPDGQLHRLAVACVDAARQARAQELRDRYVDDPSVPYGARHVVRTMTPVLVSDISTVVLSDGARHASHLRIARELGLVSYICVPLRSRGRPLGALTFVTAESGRQYGQADLRFAQELATRTSLAIENARAFDEARRANQLKDDFLATLSHELRTPLNAILGYMRMLRAGTIGPARQGRAMEIVERNAMLLNQMVEDVLDVSRIVAGKIRLHLDSVDLQAVVRDAVGTVMPAAETKGIHVSAPADVTVLPVSGDAERLQQVVSNLLSNAVKFTPEGGRVDVRVDRVGDDMVLTVSDTGIGIAPDFLPHVFERFRQADARFAREHGGLGIGLAIARHLVEAHGGAITAGSDGVGRGTTMTVRLPAAAVPKTDPPRAVAALTAGGDDALLGAQLTGTHILAVDDDADARTLMVEVLEAAGAHVRAAASVAEALAEIDRELPDAVVTDLGMPGADGFALVAQLRSSSDVARRHLPVAALTAYARSEDRTRVLHSGFQMHLPKPINPADLVAAVRALARQDKLIAE